MRCDIIPQLGLHPSSSPTMVSICMRTSGTGGFEVLRRGEDLCTCEDLSASSSTTPAIFSTPHSPTVVKQPVVAPLAYSVWGVCEGEGPLQALRRVEDLCTVRTSASSSTTSSRCAASWTPPVAYPQSHSSPTASGVWHLGGRDGACVLGRIVRAFRLTNIQLGKTFNFYHLQIVRWECFSSFQAVTSAN